MVKKQPPHDNLARRSPITWHDGDPELIVTLNYVPESRHSDHMIFKFSVVGKNHPHIPSNLPKLSFQIFVDCKVTIILDQSKKWEWSKIYHGITTKDNCLKLYGGLNYVSPNELYFFAKFNTNNHYHPKDNQKLNLNIDYFQGERSLPITIDPDVGNPLPPELIPTLDKIIPGEQEPFSFALFGDTDS